MVCRQYSKEIIRATVAHFANHLPVGASCGGHSCLCLFPPWTMGDRPRRLNKGKPPPEFLQDPLRSQSQKQLSEENRLRVAAYKVAKKAAAAAKVSTLDPSSSSVVAHAKSSNRGVVSNLDAGVVSGKSNRNRGRKDVVGSVADVVPPRPRPPSKSAHRNLDDLAGADQPKSVSALPSAVVVSNHSNDDDDDYDDDGGDHVDDDDVAVESVRTHCIRAHCW